MAASKVDSLSSSTLPSMTNWFEEEDEEIDGRREREIESVSTSNNCIVELIDDPIPDDCERNSTLRLFDPR